MENIYNLRDDIFFIYAGSGPQLELYKNFVEENKLTNVLKFIGRQNQIPGILKSCCLFLLTSKSEGMPNVILEAMASGLPVVTTPVDGVKEIIEDGINGIFVPVDDVNKMTQEIIRLADNLELRKRISTAALKRVEYFSMEKMIKNYEDIYLKLLNRV